MARIELTEEQKIAIQNIGKKEVLNNPNEHLLLQYAEGDFNYHNVIIVTLKNNTQIKKFIVPTFTQLAKRAEFYIQNGITDFLEKDLPNNKIIYIEKFVELQLEFNGELDIYFVDKYLLEE